METGPTECIAFSLVWITSARLSGAIPFLRVRTATYMVRNPTGVSASPPLRRVGNVHTFRGVAGRCSADKGGRRMLVPAQISSVTLDGVAGRCLADKGDRRVRRFA